MQVATVWEHTTGREVVGFEGSVPPGATVGRFRVQRHEEGCPSLLKTLYPLLTLPGDHLWAKLRLLLGHTCAEGLSLAHPVGFQDPMNRGRYGTLLTSQEPVLDPPLGANPRTNHCHSGFRLFVVDVITAFTYPRLTWNLLHSQS